MTPQKQKKTTTVHEHPRHVHVSKKNPDGITVVDQHIRRLHGTSLNSEEIETTYNNYNRKKIIYPSCGKLKEFKDADKYDDFIAIWTDYFNNKFNVNPPLDPDVVKALIGSESGFIADPPKNKIAVGIAQITKQTLKVLRDPHGEAKDFIFCEIRQRDLKNPNISIPLAIRWLFRKKETATSKIKRQPTAEELILEYKGLLKSNTSLKIKALENFREKYAKLKK